MIDYYYQVNEAKEFIRSKTDFVPEIAFILGTGLDGLIDVISIDEEIAYDDIPNFPLSTVEFHTGKLIFGYLSGRRIVAMQGRFHYYEGYSMQEITLPVRVIRQLGAEILIISNACGSMNPKFLKSSIMLIDDHINLLGNNPLRGINHEKFGKRFADMSEPYSQRLIKLSQEIGDKENIVLHKGVYCAMPGPMLETRAEYRFLRTIGADVVGMSTVPETIAARQMEMEVLGLSIITDECDPDNLRPVEIDEIIENARKAESNLKILVAKLMERL